MTHGIITTPQPEAVESGALVLLDGGNTVDAAIESALVQTVVDPMMCGIAGFGTLQLYLPDRDYHGYIDFHTTAPNSVKEDRWAAEIDSEARDGFGFILKNRAPEVRLDTIGGRMCSTVSMRTARSNGFLGKRHHGGVHIRKRMTR